MMVVGGIIGLLGTPRGFNGLSATPYANKTARTCNPCSQAIRSDRGILCRKGVHSTQDTVQVRMLVRSTAMGQKERLGSRTLECITALELHSCFHLITSDPRWTKRRKLLLTVAPEAAVVIFGIDSLRQPLQAHPRAAAVDETIEVGAPLPVQTF